MHNSSLNEYGGSLDEVDMEDSRNGSQVCNEDEKIEDMHSSEEMKQLEPMQQDAERCPTTHLKMALIEETTEEFQAKILEALGDITHCLPN